MGKFDDTFKDFVQGGLTQLMAWLRPDLKLVSVIQMPQELPATVRRVDLLAKATSEGDLTELQILECQAGKDPSLPQIMLLRAALAHVQYGHRVCTILLVLTREALVEEEYAYGRHRGRDLVHAVEVRRLYDEPADAALRSGPEVILPLVPVMRPEDGDRGRVLEAVIGRITELAVGPERKKQMIAWAATFATLNLPPIRVDVIVRDVCRRRNFMLNALEDLPLLRDTFRAGEEKGHKEGIEQERRSNLILLYEDRHGPMPPALREALGQITDPEALRGLFSLFLHGSPHQIASTLLS